MNWAYFQINSIKSISKSFPHKNQLLINFHRIVCMVLLTYTTLCDKTVQVTTIIYRQQFISIVPDDENRKLLFPEKFPFVSHAYRVFEFRLLLLIIREASLLSLLFSLFWYFLFESSHEKSFYGHFLIVNI